MNYNLKLHWEKIYDEKNEDEVQILVSRRNQRIDKMIQNAGIENQKLLMLEAAEVNY